MGGGGVAGAGAAAGARARENRARTGRLPVEGERGELAETERAQREPTVDREVYARLDVCREGNLEREGVVAVEEELVELRVELRRLVVVHRLPARQERQRREEPGDGGNVRRVGDVRLGGGGDPREEGERGGVLADGVEELAVLNRVHRHAAVRVTRREQLPVGPPCDAADGRVETADEEEALPRGAVDGNLRVGGDEREQVHRRTPLHREHIAAHPLGKALEHVERRGHRSRADVGTTYSYASRGKSARVVV